MPRILKSAAVISAAVMSLSGAASAAEPQAIAAFKDWHVFVREVDGDKVCFAATEAKDKSPSNVTHGDVFFLVASWASGAAKYQPSLMTGYNLKDAPSPSIRIDSEKWRMYASENEAFIEAAADEQRLVSAMRRGANMNVSAVSGRGTATSYTISLQGVTAALERVEKECG
jgi:invasion protein IalB